MFKKSSRTVLGSLLPYTQIRLKNYRDFFLFNHPVYILFERVIKLNKYRPLPISDNCEDDKQKKIGGESCGQKLRQIKFGIFFFLREDIV